MQIEVDRVSKHFTSADGVRHIALDDVSLQCEEGDFISLLGPSGCGKTTLLNMIAGLDHPTLGTVAFQGKPVKKPSPERGVIFQHYSLFPWLTVRGNVEFGLKYCDMTRSARRATVDRYLDMVGLAAAADRLPKELSGGMRQRCALARALVVNPQTLLMDEPFGALDAMTRRQLQVELRAIYEKEGKTIVFVTHDVDEAVFLSKRIVIMGTGPGHVEEVLDVPLPARRGQETVTSEAFVGFREKVWELIPMRLVSKEVSQARDV